MVQKLQQLHKGDDAELGAVTVSSLTIDGVALLATSILLGSGEVVDLNGEADALVLDADANTTISAPTDNQIDFEISGADDFRMTANTFTALSGSTIATNTIAETTAASGVTIDGMLVKDAGLVVGTSGYVDLNGETGGLIIDADANTKIYGSADDVITINVAGASDFTIGANVLTALSGSSIATNTISETTAASGVTIDGALLKDGRSNLGRQVQALTASGAITIGSGLLTLAHDTVVIAATLAAPVAGDELFIVDASAGGTAAHTVTVAGGVTLDGTNTIATLNAPGEALHLVALSATRWFILENIGSVALS